MKSKISSRLSRRKFKYAGRTNGKPVCCLEGDHMHYLIYLIYL